MRYLYLTNTGNWYFRYQLSPSLRHLFKNHVEIKRSLKTSCKLEAKLIALKLELDIRSTITEYLKGTKVNIALSSKSISASPDKNVTKVLSPIGCLDKYHLSKADLVTQKTNEGNYAKLKTILCLLNKKNLSSIRRIDADEVRRLLQQYPVNAKKQQAFVGLNAREVIQSNSKLNLPTLSIASVRNYIHKASGFFEWCLQMELTDINPFKGFKFKETKKASEHKEHYTNQELKRLFSTDIHTLGKHKCPYQYWLPILASLTGTRLNELCQLYVSDIQFIDCCWVMNISDSHDDQKLKNTSSKRTIPLHSHLISLGFIEYVKSLDSNRIFPELKLTRDGYGSSVSKWFGRFKSKIGFKKGHDFHSFRHTFTNELKQQSVSQVIVASIIGHSQGGITFDRYGKDLDIPILKNAIEMLNISHLKSVERYKKY
jgi:integrase